MIQVFTDVSMPPQVPGIAVAVARIQHGTQVTRLRMKLHLEPGMAGRTGIAEIRAAYHAIQYVWTSGRYPDLPLRLYIDQAIQILTTKKPGRTPMRMREFLVENRIEFLHPGKHSLHQQCDRDAKQLGRGLWSPHHRHSNPKSVMWAPPATSAAPTTTKPKP